MNNIPFNQLYKTGNELQYIAESSHYNQLSGDEPFSKRCHAWLQEQTGCSKALSSLDRLKFNNIQAVSHYVPLYSSPAGLCFGRAHGDLSLTNSL